MTCKDPTAFEKISTHLYIYNYVFVVLSCNQVENPWQLARRSNMTGINPSTACTYMSSSKVHLYHTTPKYTIASMKVVLSFDVYSTNR